MKTIDFLTVSYHKRPVGRLTSYGSGRTAFQYDQSWLENGFSISPFSLPADNRVFISGPDPFEGLFGVFNDSLPDGWGRLLVDRFLSSIGERPERYGCLNRLAVTGTSGMGALTYEPCEEYEEREPDHSAELDLLASQCRRLIESDIDVRTSDLDYLFRHAGSSGGARPKILTRIGGDEGWIIKFPSREDPPDIGAEEYAYNLCAVECGIRVPETRLFPSTACEGYFGVKRFDRVLLPDGSLERIHMVTASGLLETSHRLPSLDYDGLLKLTEILTRSRNEVKEMYRRLCFNVFAHNRDDHSKNFSFIYKDGEERWLLSPAYDLTWSSSLGGEHATSVHGNGSAPGLKDILLCAEAAGLPRSWSKNTAEEIREIVNTRLAGYLNRRY